MRFRSGLALALSLFTACTIDAAGSTPGLALAHPGHDDFGIAADSGSAAGSRGGPFQRVGSFVGNFGSDVWYVATSPTRINRKGFFYTVGFLAMTGALYAYDQEISDAFHRSEGNPIYDAVIAVGDVVEPIGHMGKTNPYYVAGAIVGTTFSISPVQTFTYEILESHIISGGLRNLAKIVIGRRRPNEETGARRFELNGGTSFPSGHASVVFELATILSHYTKRPPATFVYYGLAGAVALQRIDSDQHWPSDVLLSAVSGTLVARVVVHRNEARRGHDVPVIGLLPWKNGLMVTASF